MLESLVNWVAGSKKAIAAFVVTAVISYTARHGWNVDEGTQDALRVLLEALVVGVTVWFTRNRVGAVNRSK